MMSARKIGTDLAVAMLPLFREGAIILAEGPQAYGRCRWTCGIKHTRRDVVLMKP
jgi:hypothetical protein